MSDPKRLRTGDDLGATLVASALADAPPSGARERTKVAIGVGAGVGLAAATTAKATSAATKGLISGFWMKVAGGAIVTTTVATATIVQVTKDHARPPVATAATTTAAAPRPMAAPTEATAITPPSPAPVETKEEIVAAAPVVRTTPAIPTVKTSPKSEATESALAQELAMLDEARSALAAGNASRALTVLDRFDRAFPAGALRTEAAVLRAEALLGSGDRAGAQKLARGLLARDPAGPHAKRLTTIADGAK